MRPHSTTRCYSDAWLRESPLKGPAVLIFLKLLAPVIAGGAAGAITMVGVVYDADRGTRIQPGQPADPDLRRLSQPA